MAILSSFPKGQPSLSDTLIGSKYEEGKDPATKQFSIQDIVNLVPAGPTGPTGPEGPEGPQGPAGPESAVGLYSQCVHSNAITNASGEGYLLSNGIGTYVGSLSVPANTFYKGNSFKLNVGGVMSCGNNQNLRIRVYSDETGELDFIDITNIPTTTNKKFDLQVVFTIREIGEAGTAIITSSSSFLYNRDASNNIEGLFTNFVNDGSFDTTTLNTLSVTAIWMTTNAANSLISETAVLHKIY